MLTLAFILIAFLCGSLPFSVWLGKGVLGVDVRRFGDGNPGSANVFRAGSRGVALAALLLDVSKAAAPVGLVYFNLGLRGAPMVLISLAPILGHAFSPFLHFKGGKALAGAALPDHLAGDRVGGIPVALFQPDRGVDLERTNP